MKQTQKISAVIMMFLLIGVLLLTSFQVAIYGDSQYRFYEREYKKYQVANNWFVLTTSMPESLF